MKEENTLAQDKNCNFLKNLRAWLILCVIVQMVLLKYLC